MNKFWDFFERLVKIFILTSAFTIMFLIVTFSIFYLFGVILSDESINFFVLFAFVCMAIVSYVFLKEVEIKD